MKRRMSITGTDEDQPTKDIDTGNDILRTILLGVFAVTDPNVVNELAALNKLLTKQYAFGKEVIANISKVVNTTKDECGENIQ